MKRLFELFANGGREAKDSRKRRLLAEAVWVEEELVPAFVRPLLMLVAVVVLVFLLWAALTHITEVARAPGEVRENTQ